MNILLIGQFSAEVYETWIGHLTPHLAPDDILLRADQDHDSDQVDIAVVANPEYGALTRYPRLHFVQSLWAGVERLLADPTLPPQLPVARLIDPELTGAMVECAAASTLFLHRQFPAYQAQQKQARWQQLAQPTARTRKVGILGLGELGRASAIQLAALGFAVSGWSRGPQDIAGIACHHGADGFDAVARSSEIMINLLPLTPETTGILNGALFERLPKGASIVNLARGGHLVEEDLLKALGSGQIGHAILDVFTQEPLPEAHPFWSHPRITVLPHVAAHTEPATAALIALNNIAAFRRGDRIIGQVDRSKGY